MRFRRVHYTIVAMQEIWYASLAAIVNSCILFFINVTTMWFLVIFFYDKTACFGDAKTTWQTGLHLFMRNCQDSTFLSSSRI
jgi:hypothetical protein